MNKLSHQAESPLFTAKNIYIYIINQVKFDHSIAFAAFQPFLEEMPAKAQSIRGGGGLSDQT